MHRRLSNLIAPHYCCSCGEIGSLLCENCKYDISLEPYAQCLQCRAPSSVATGLCGGCITPYSRAWCIGEKQGALEKLIDAHKFERAKDAYLTFADLLHDTLPILPEDIRIVPVPTIPVHIRRRGYDHTALFAKAFASKRHLTVATPLLRLTRDTQRGATKAERHKQAARAFASEHLDGGIYLLLDDVYTTGATVEYAAKALRDAGADDVWVAVIARQPLEK